MKSKNLWAAMILAAALTVCLIPLSASAKTASFDDVSENAWYAEAVSYVSENGLMKGVSETAFAPEGTVTRGMIVTIMYRQAGQPAFVGKADFRDVAADAWYADAVKWGAEVGLVLGYGNGLFGPNDAITREQLAVILYQYAKIQGMDVSKQADLKAFKDAGSVSSWAADPVRWAVAEGLISGVTADTLAPEGSATRAQTAAILMRLFNKAPSLTGPALLKSVDVYGIDYETKEWTLTNRLTYEYENGYPVKLDNYDVNLEEHMVTTFEYTFENGLPLTKKEYDREGTLQSTTDYINGKINEINSTSADGTVNTRTMYQYANGDAHFTLQLFSRVCMNEDMTQVDFTMEEVDSVQVTTKNGLLARTTNTGLYANWNGNEDKEWMRFNGTYTANYDADGILNNTSAVFRSGPSGSKDLFAVTKENGMITEVVRSLQYEGQDAELQAKYVFAYTDIEIDPVRYATMINAHIIDPSNNFYRYYWY